MTVTDASSNLLRMRQSDVDCTPGTGTTGNVTENRRYLGASGPIAVTDMTARAS